jgi:hypothetical protein
MKKTILFALLLSFQSAQAMDLDWSGQFRAEAARISNYSMDSSDAGASRDGVRDAQDGYYVYGAGGKTAHFQTLFLRLQPKLIVNDNVSIKSEWWLGNPVSGFYGSGMPTGNDNYYNSTYSTGSTIVAQRFWAEFLSDIGTLQVGRAPWHWGMGLVHHAGDGIFDRYQTTGDTIRLISKFGAFSLIPSTTKYKNNGAIGGTCVGAIGGDGTCASNAPGGAGVSEYSLSLRYENPDEDFEGGVSFIRRIGGAQNTNVLINNNNPPSAGTTAAGGMNYTVWDIYAKKKAGKFDFQVEAPIFSGDLLGTPYKAYALATEIGFRANDTWHFNLRGGKVPGQSNITGTTPTKYGMVYFHPNYKLGVIMFNYQLRNFARNNNSIANATSTTNGAASIYDNPITNANYLAFGTALNADKWKFSLGFLTATADQTAIQNQRFFNSVTRKYSTAVAVKSQDKSLGSEIDFGIGLQWDEFTRFGIDLGYYMPGNFFSFSNVAATDNATDAVFGAVASVGVAF